MESKRELYTGKIKFGKEKMECEASPDCVRLLGVCQMDLCGCPTDVVRVIMSWNATADTFLS